MVSNSCLQWEPVGSIFNHSYNCSIEPIFLAAVDRLLHLGMASVEFVADRTVGTTCDTISVVMYTARIVAGLGMIESPIAGAAPPFKSSQRP